MNAEAILAIPEAEPERLFPNSEDEAKAQYRKLMEEWHPDRNPAPAAVTVSGHLAKLYRAVCDKIRGGTWTPPSTFVLHGVDGKARSIRYKKRYPFELGEFGYGERVLVYILRPEFEDLYECFVARVTTLSYATPEMRAEFTRYIPAILDRFKTKDGRLVVVQAKTPDVFLLRDVVKALSGKVPPKHVAWMLSALHNIACFLAYNEVAHGDISLDTCFVSPQHHSMLLLGGWWYTARRHVRLHALPARSMRLLPAETIRDRISDPHSDLTLIRALGCELLGEVAGAPFSKDVPKPMAAFLRSWSHGDPIADYKAWKEVLNTSFGARRFIELGITAGDIFKE